MNLRPAFSAAACALACASLVGVPTVHAAEPDDLEQDLAIVRAHWQAGEVRAALSHAHLTAGEHPDSTEAVAWLAMILDRVGQAQAAMDTLRRALAMHPQDKHLIAAMQRLQADRQGCSATLDARNIEAGRFIPGRHAYALAAASGRPRLVPGLITRGNDAMHARFSASQVLVRPMLVVDAGGHLVAQGSDPQNLQVAAPDMAPTPAARSMSAEELYERLLPNVVQDQPCD